MKAYLINMHLLVPRSKSSAKVKVKYKGYISQKMAVSGAFVFHKHILFFKWSYDSFSDNQNDTVYLAYEKTCNVLFGSKRVKVE